MIGTVLLIGNAGSGMPVSAGVRAGVLIKQNEHGGNAGHWAFPECVREEEMVTA